MLVDGTQGIQAQTLVNFEHAKKMGLTVIGAVNKIDLNPPLLQESIEDLRNSFLQTGTIEDMYLHYVGEHYNEH